MSADAPQCDGASACITCGDQGVPMRVVRVGAGGDALCAAGSGPAETVAVDLVGPVRAGDGVLVHAGVAIGRLEEAPR